MRDIKEALKLRLVRLPLAFLYRAAGGGENKRIRFAAGLGAGPVHRLGHLIGRMARHVLFQSVAEQLAPGFLAPPCEPLGSVEDFIGNRDRDSHTFSVTDLPCRDQACQWNCHPEL